MYGEWRDPAPVLGRATAQLLEEAEELEHRARRRDIVVDEHTLFDFYDARVGAEVVSRRALRHLVEAAPASATPTCSPSTRRCWSTSAPTTVAEQDYPDLWREGDLALPLTYQFEPGAADGRGDGRRTGGDAEPGRARRRSPGRCPGCAHDLVVALIRSLPKHAAGQLRARARTSRGSSWPPRRRGRSRCSTPWSGYLRATHRGGRPARGLGLAEGARRTCGRRSGWSARTARVVAAGKDLDALKAPLRPTVRRGDGRGGLGVRARRHRRRPPGPSARSSGRSPRPAPATRCAASRRWSTRGRRSGCGCSAPRPSRTPRTGCGLRRLLRAARCRRRPRRSPTGSSNADKLGLAGSPYPSVTDAARRLRRRGRRTRWSTGTALVWDEPAFDALRGAVRAAAGGHDPAWSSATCCGCWPRGATSTSCSAGPRTCRCCPRWRT